jgi:hypothetical protein
MRSCNAASPDRLCRRDGAQVLLDARREEEETNLEQARGRSAFTAGTSWREEFDREIRFPR